MKGKVDVRITQRDGKARLRFYGINPDQLEIIRLALEKARQELNTAFDSVAFEAICGYFLMDHGSANAFKQFGMTESVDPSITSK